MIAVIGNCNVSMTLPVPKFPLEYDPARYLSGQIELSASGVALNVAQAIAGQKEGVLLVAPIGLDSASTLVQAHCQQHAIDFMPCTTIERTPLSVVMIEPSGQRMINTDLGDTLNISVPNDLVDNLVGYSPAGVVLGNVPWTTSLIRPLRSRNIEILTDLQDLQGSNNPYDEQFFHANYLTASHERVQHLDLEWLAATILEKSYANAFFLTLGREGVLVAERGEKPIHIPTQTVDGVSTSGAGDMFTAILAYHLLELRTSATDAAKIAVDHVTKQLANRLSAQ